MIIRKYGQPVILVSFLVGLLTSTCLAGVTKEQMEAIENFQYEVEKAAHFGYLGKQNDPKKYSFAEEVKEFEATQKLEFGTFQDWALKKEISPNGLEISPAHSAMRVAATEGYAAVLDGLIDYFYPHSKPESNVLADLYIFSYFWRYAEMISPVRQYLEIEFVRELGNYSPQLAFGLGADPKKNLELFEKNPFYRGMEESIALRGELRKFLNPSPAKKARRSSRSSQELAQLKTIDIPKFIQERYPRGKIDSYFFYRKEQESQQKLQENPQKKDGERPSKKRKMNLSPELEKAFQALGIRPIKDLKEIKAAYRKGLLENHPDRNGDTAKVREIIEGFQLIREKFSELPEDL